MSSAFKDVTLCSFLQNDWKGIKLLGNKINSLSNDEAKQILLKPILQQKGQRWSICNMQNLNRKDRKDMEVKIYVFL